MPLQAIMREVKILRLVPASQTAGIDPNGTFDQDYHVADLSLSRVTQIVLSYRRQRGAMTRTRKIVAIFAADVVGFSRMTGADEDGALSRLRALRAETHP